MRVLLSTAFNPQTQPAIEFDRQQARSPGGMYSSQIALCSRPLRNLQSVVCFHLNFWVAYFNFIISPAPLLIKELWHIIIFIFILADEQLLAVQKQFFQTKRQESSWNSLAVLQNEQTKSWKAVACTFVSLYILHSCFLTLFLALVYGILLIYQKKFFIEHFFWKRNIKK